MTPGDRPDPISYLLGELEPGSAAAFETQMAEDPGLRRRVEQLRPVVDRLERLPAAAWDPPSPPPLQPPPAEARRAERRLVLRPAVALMCAAAMLLAGLGIGVLLDREGDERAPAVVAEVPLQPVGPTAVKAGGRVEIRRPGRSRLTLRVSGLRPLAGGRFYELWLLGRRGQLVALGSFRVTRTGTASIALPLPVEPRRFRYFDVSLEPADGDPAHSGASVLRGPTSS